MSFCGKCGAKAQSEDRFCRACGAPVGEVTKPQESEAEPAAPEVQPPPEAPTESPPQPTADTSSTGREYKGVWIRFVAQFIDGLILLIPLGIAFLIFGYLIGAMTGGIAEDGSFDLNGIPALLLMVIMFLLVVLYFAYMESAHNGQSLGKKVTRIQVIDVEGRAPAFKTSFIRNLLRCVDVLFFYLVGAIFIWRSKTKQRLGDRIANTFVVKKVAGNNDAQPPEQKKKKWYSALTNKDDTVFMDMD